MPEVVNGNNILLGRGKIYFDRFNSSGVRTGELFLGNCPTFEITPTSEDIKKYSSADRSADLIASDVLRTTLAIRIVGDEFSKENLAMALFGDTATLSQTGAAVTNEAISDVLQGRYYALSKRQVSLVSVTGVGGTPAYVLNTDYKVDAVTGRIYIVEGGGIADLTDIEVDYTYGTIALPTIRGMSQTSIKGYLRFIGDPARGPKYECEIWRASLRADGAIGFISDEYASFTLAGDIESDAASHPNEPHYRLIQDRVMTEKHILGGRTFLPLRESTVEQDFRFLALIKRARVDEVVMQPGESPEAFARRLLEVTIESGVILDLLGCLLIPEDLAPRDRDPGEVWTSELGRETAQFLGQLRDPKDKAEVRGLVLSLLVSFFESGIVSLWTSRTSSVETIPIPDSNPAHPDGMAPGPSWSGSSPQATTTERIGSFAGRCESPSPPTVG